MCPLSCVSFSQAVDVAAQMRTVLSQPPLTRVIPRTDSSCKRRVADVRGGTQAGAALPGAALPQEAACLHACAGRGSRRPGDGGDAGCVRARDGAVAPLAVWTAEAKKMEKEDGGDEGAGASSTVGKGADC